jgi:5-methylcytosine-specific restriction protein A
MLDFWVDSAIISKCTENRCFPSPQQTSARRAKTAKTLDSPGLGRLPVLSLSAYATISGRSLLRADVPAALSYEALVLAYPDRFAEDVLAIARERMGREAEVLEPTADPLELERRVHELLNRTTVAFPTGVNQPQRVAVTTVAFLRDPRVKAYVLHRAKGRCEACSNPAPFKTALGLDFLEVHHMKPLAEGGSDRVQNAVALCPNCHRAMHNAADAKKRTEQLYSQVGGSLIPE